MPEIKTYGPRRASLVLAFATIYLVWGSTYLAIRVAVADVPPFLMAGLRFTAGGGLLYLFLRWRGVPAPPARQWRHQAVGGLLALVGGNALTCWAEQTVPSGLTSLIVGGSPLILILIERIRPGGPRPTPGLLAGVAVGILGLALLLGPGAFPHGTRPPWRSVAALVCAATCWWSGSLYSKHVGHAGHGLMSAALQMLVGAAGMFGVALALGEPARFHPRAVPPVAWGAIVYLIVAGSLIAYPTYLWLLRHCAPSRVATYAYVNPLIAVILGWALLGEPLTPRIAVSAAIIVAAVAIITAQKQGSATQSPSAEN